MSSNDKTKFPRRHLGIAYAIGLVPAVALAAGQPVWSRVDEAAHYDVIAQYAAGVYPKDAVTAIRPETLEVMQLTGVYGFVVDNAYVKPDPGFEPIPTGVSSSAYVLWVRRHGYEFSYEAFQPPLYYAAATPAWFAGDSIDGAVGALIAVRVFDALLAGLLAPLSMLLLLKLWPGNRPGAWAAALLTAVLPGVAINLTSVTNDVLVTVLGGACVLSAIGGSWTRRRTVGVGLLFGAALLTKTTAIAIAPALVVALLQSRRGGGFRPLFAVGAIAALCVAPWVIANLAIYGEVFTTREQLAMAAFPPRTADEGFWTLSTLHSFVTFWSGDPFLSIPGSVALAVMAAFVVALSAAGVARATQRNVVTSRPVMSVLAAAAGGSVLVSVTSPILAAFNAPGRLAYAGLCAVIALVVAGLWVELPAPRLRWATIGIFAGLCVASLAVFAYPAAPGAPGEGHPLIAKQTPVSASGVFADLSVSIGSCATDATGNQWIQVTFENSGTEPVEWSQTAEIHDGGARVASSDYTRSTQFPLAFAPGHTYPGWLWIGPAPLLHGLKDTSLYFRDLAANAYTTVGDLDIPAQLC